MDVIKLLLVEDDPNFRSLLTEVLEAEGFEVTVATSGSEALKILEGEGASFSALLTDIKVGSGPKGWDVAHRARELFSGIPVVYISGTSVEEWSANGVPESVILQKPFLMAQVVTAFATLLNQASGAPPPSDPARKDPD